MSVFVLAYASDLKMEVIYSSETSVDFKRNIYLLLKAIGLIPGGSVYKDHTFNKETAHHTNFHSTST
jgi:hypothetical protein